MKITQACMTGAPYPPPKKNHNFIWTPKKGMSTAVGGAAMPYLLYTTPILFSFFSHKNLPFLPPSFSREFFSFTIFLVPKSCQISDIFRCREQYRGIVGDFPVGGRGGGQRKMLTSPTLILCKINGLFPLLAFKSHTIIKIILGGGPLYKFFLKKKK